jgi:DNA-3-methyladenine glycosylase II
MIPSDDQLAAAAVDLRAACDVIARAHDVVGMPPWRSRPAGFSGLARIIVFQQLSTKAAETIWSRVEAQLGEVTPERALAAEVDALRACGLSRPKIAHVRSIAEAARDGRLDFARIAAADDEAAREELVAVKGVGPWTADIYLMFCTGRLDVFPHGDLGLIEAYRQLTDAGERLAPKLFLAVGERWRPWRAVAAHLLWSYLNADRAKVAGGA